MRGLPLAQPATLKTPEGRAALHGWSPELMVVVAYGLILPLAVLKMPRMGCLNIHGSLLPRWRGAAPIQRAILAGDVETGVSIMQLEEGLDTGPVLLERRHAIGTQDTAGDVHDALSELGAAALLEAIDGFAAGTVVPRAQPAEGVTYAAKIEKSEAPLDWSKSAHSLDRAGACLQSLAGRGNPICRRDLACPARTRGGARRPRGDTRHLVGHR